MSKKAKTPVLTFDRILLQPDVNETIKELKREAADDEDLRNEIDKAAFFQHVLTSHHKIRFSDEQKKQQVDRLLSRIRNEERSAQDKRFVWLTRIAASLLILVAFTGIVMRKDIRALAGMRKAAVELVVPSGEKSKVILADGSVVWINSESRLIYPIGFKGRERKVILEGEAYFDVAKVRKSPFVVYTQDVSVRVTGTKFNVKSYPKDRTIETTVVEGSVRVEDKEEKVRFSPVLLKSSERMVLRKEYINEPAKEIKSEKAGVPVTVDKEPSAEEITIGRVNTEYITCWKDHLLVFYNESLEEIAIKMSRWYKVEVVIPDADLRKQRYTGKFVNNESLDQVLEAINLTTPIQYTFDKSSVEITPKAKK